MAQPTSAPDWTAGNPNQGTISIEPSAGKKQGGWTGGERPPHQTMNWLFQNISEWIGYIRDEVAPAVFTNAEYDATVGFGGTHADLAALMADPEVAAGNIKNVLISQSQNLTSPVALNQNDMNFVFKPGVTVFKDTGATRALVISAERVRVLNARFSGFNVSGDIAVELTGTSKYCIIGQSYFNDCDTTIQDDGATNVLSNNVEEV